MTVNLTILQDLIENGYDGELCLVDSEFVPKNPYKILEKCRKRIGYDEKVLLTDRNGDVVSVKASYFCFKKVYEEKDIKQDKDVDDKKTECKPPVVYNPSTGKYELEDSFLKLYLCVLYENAPTNLKELVRKEVKERLSILGQSLLNFDNL